MNRNFAVELANAIPFDTHLTTLKEAIEEYFENPTEEAKECVMMGVMLTAMKGVTDNKSVDEVIKDLNDIERANNFFKTTKN